MGQDAGHEMGHDMEWDTGRDIRTGLGLGAGPDKGHEMGYDTERDIRRDKGHEPGRDTGHGTRVGPRTAAVSPRARGRTTERPPAAWQGRSMLERPFACRSEPDRQRPVGRWRETETRGLLEIRPGGLGGTMRGPGGHRTGNRRVMMENGEIQMQNRA